MMKSSSNSDLLFTDYLVVFFDLMGQREALRKITGIPISRSGKQEFIALIKKSIGRVLMIRDAFKSYFDAAASHTPNVSLVPPEHRNEFIESQKTDFSYYGLSDAIVIAVPLMGENENCTAINGVYSALTATCGIALVSLSLGIPARAGIDVGIATQIDDREVYGPALERAVHLEAQLAEYPRLVVGRELLSYLSWVENQQFQTRLGEIASNMAKVCRKFIVQDTDGRVMLDYLGENVKEAFGGKMDKGIVAKAWNFVNEQHIFQIKNGNDKLASRYFRMIRYFNSRLKIWGIE
ncbi:MAG: hypothetical protein JRI90_16590 [Deltaproteobacteria bacterium]|nr:hypothetical protein [Deltaproteobacteria bacterium]